MKILNNLIVVMAIGCLIFGLRLGEKSSFGMKLDFEEMAVSFGGGKQNVGECCEPKAGCNPVNFTNSCNDAFRNMAEANCTVQDIPVNNNKQCTMRPGGSPPPLCVDGAEMNVCLQSQPCYWDADTNTCADLGTPTDTTSCPNSCTIAAGDDTFCP